MIDMSLIANLRPNPNGHASSIHPPISGVMYRLYLEVAKATDDSMMRSIERRSSVSRGA